MKKFAAVPGGALLLLLAASPRASAATSVAELTSLLDSFWVLVAAALVLLMQMGFMLLEAGAARTKNAVNVAQKNLLDLAFAVLAFAAIGFMITFGRSTTFLPVGTDTGLFLLRDLDAHGAFFFIFQVMFCGTAATIVAGAVAERMKLSVYVWFTVITSALIYPVYAHWAWGAALGPNSGAWLANTGFVDFAGSTVVHSTGAWIALAGCIVLGARRGRFQNGKPVRFTGHSPVLSAVGTLFLFVGWIGFNGGSTLAATPQVAQIVLHTVLAGGAGAAAAYGLFTITDGVAYPEKTVNGMIGGLVAITAGCHLLDPMTSVLVGALGGMIATWGHDILERRLRIDDAVGAVGAHGFAGAFGTLALALLAPEALLPAGSHLAQLKIQFIGVGTNFVWAFGAGFAVIKLIDMLFHARVDAETESRGLNLGEHGVRLGTAHVETAMESLVAGQADLAMRLDSPQGDDAQYLTDLFNSLMDKLQTAEEERNSQADKARSQEEAERLAAFADAAFEAIVLSSEGKVVDANSAAEQLFHLNVAELRGRSVSTLFRFEDWPEALEHLGDDTGRPQESHIQPVNGAVVPVEFRCRSITYDGRATQVLAFADLRERRKAQERIYHLALHDPLTDLPNRTMFNQRLDEMVRRTPEDGLNSALLMIDLDRFKSINDLHGHPSGDAVIRAVADRLRSAADEADCVARLGGDEFAFIKRNIAFANQAADLAHRLLHSISEPVTLPNGKTIRPSGSIGVAVCPRDGTAAEILFQNCDVSLYAAKAKGRNAYAVYEPGMGAKQREMQQMEEELHGAIERNELQLHFQPRLDIASREIGALEALLRWNHPVRGTVSPDEFVAVAEQSALIISIGEWVLTESCKVAAREWKTARISVNVSPRQLQDLAFPETVREALKVSGLKASRLELEVTEGLFIDDPEPAAKMLAELKGLGVRISLDDFGTGYSSLSYLKRFPFDTIKIDRSFISEMTEDGNALHITDTILRLSTALGMSVVAEGVEDENQLRRLAEKGCTEAQGFFIATPQPIEELDLAVSEDVTGVLDSITTDTDRLVAALNSVTMKMNLGQLSGDAFKRSRPA